MTGTTSVDWKVNFKETRRYNRDNYVVLDETLLPIINVSEGLKSDGSLIVNSTESTKEITNRLGLKGPSSYCVDATGISHKILESSRGFNTVMLGALTESTKIISMKSAQEAVRSRFSGQLLEKNLKLLEAGSKEVIV